MGYNVSNIVKKMLEENSDINSFPEFLAGYNFGRGLFTDNKNSPHIVASHQVSIWRVIHDRLEQKDDTNLFNGENYVIEWHFDYVLNAGGDINTQIFFFHWKGINAVKGFSPVPADRNLENAIVERIYQWGEPPVFFHIFPQKIIVLNGKEEDFKPSRPHLLMLRGEIINELHLFEIPCCWKNFRSRAIFFIIVPDKRNIFIWIGNCVDSSIVTMVQKGKNWYSNIKDVHKSWNDFKFIEVQEGDDEILDEVMDDSREYLSIKSKTVMFTPRIFYLVFNGVGISPVEIKNPLRAPSINAPFPFLQTHLYSAPQPGKFKNDGNK